MKCWPDKSRKQTSPVTFPSTNVLKAAKPVKRHATGRRTA